MFGYWGILFSYRGNKIFGYQGILFGFPSSKMFGYRGTTVIGRGWKYDLQMRLIVYIEQSYLYGF